MFLWLKWLTDGKIKNRRLPTLHCDTMATVQSCPDCAGFANETVPFLALFFLPGTNFSRMRHHFWALGEQAIAERYVVSPRYSSERVPYVQVHRGDHIVLIE